MHLLFPTHLRQMQEARSANGKHACFQRCFKKHALKRLPAGIKAAAPRATDSDLYVHWQCLSAACRWQSRTSPAGRGLVLVGRRSAACFSCWADFASAWLAAWLGVGALARSLSRRGHGVGRRRRRQRHPDPEPPAAAAHPRGGAAAGLHHARQRGLAAQHAAGAQPPAEGHLAQEHHHRRHPRHPRPGQRPRPAAAAPQVGEPPRCSPGDMATVPPPGCHGNWAPPPWQLPVPMTFEVRPHPSYGYGRCDTVRGCPELSRAPRGVLSYILLTEIKSPGKAFSLSHWDQPGRVARDRAFSVVAAPCYGIPFPTGSEKPHLAPASVAFKNILELWGCTSHRID